MISVSRFPFRRGNSYISFSILNIFFWVNDSLVYYILLVTLSIHGTIHSRFTITFVLFIIIIIIIIIIINIIIIRSVMKFLNYLFIMIIDYLKNIFRAGVTNF